MNKKVKILLAIIAILIIGLMMLLYFAFCGLPWLKIYHKYALKDYLADKYDQEIVITETLYNFKDGHYGVAAYPRDNPELKFTAWQHYDQEKKYRDYYPEEVWDYQARTDYIPILNELYPDATRIRISGVRGISDQMIISKKIPHYLEVEHFFGLIINLDQKLTAEIIDNEVARLDDLIVKIKEDGAAIDIMIVYSNKNDDSKERDKYINLDYKENDYYPTRSELIEIYTKAAKGQ